MLLSQWFFASNVVFAGVCHISLPFLDLLFVRFLCRRLFAKFFDLRSGLSVSLPLRSVGTLSPSPRESCFCKPRNNLEPCTASLELCRKSLASQEIRTKDIRFAVNSTKRNLDTVIVSQVYSQACHTAFILVRARGWHWVESCSCL